MDFNNKLQNAINDNNSLVCVGLDPDPFQGVSLKGQDSFFKFNKKIIDQTFDLVCAYKPNIAFYAAAGIKGLGDLKKTIDYIHKKYPQIPVLLDAKRGDVGHTSEMYVQEVFDFLQVDAVTVNPYLGEDSLEPFFKRKDKGIVVICRTSNPSAVDFQDAQVNGEPLYMQVARKVVAWDKKYNNLLMVVGATYPEEMKKVREITPEMTFLVPGVGEQGGDLEATLKNGLIALSLSSLRKRGSRTGLIISASRGIIYALDPRAAAQKLRNEINKYR